ncbi:beclin 1-associated autophagy-related key regulator-like [Acanthaster planci]|uniref:Beclin 1-associated autophagy-related key regulator-like n=1 Tax=Acanthaster planci TaxID=133434 RepID=A0A8B7YXY9_ACAPL|nr:beclin 1-associated autophagy-related key regulator-like [Acanthaster planci]
MAAFDSEEKGENSQNEFPTIAPPFGGLLIAVERCPLCERTKKPFTCQKCVEKGDFVHSNSCGNGKNSERFSDKLNRLKQLRKERSDIFERVSKKLERAVSAAAKKWEISMLKDRLELMEKALEENKERCQADEASQMSQNSRIKDRVNTARTHMTKLERIQKVLENGKGALVSRRSELDGYEKKLSELRRTSVNQLTTYIFSINEIHTGDSKPTHLEEEDQLVADLADARRTAYVQGRWIETENSHEVQYSLVHPSAVSIPANGDYTAYSTWVAAKESANQGTDTQLDLDNPGKVLGGALCHTAQLVSVLTFYLGVVLPKKCPFGVFCGEQLSSHDFYKAVDKLNTNVLYLCFSQNVDVECLHPHYTVRNLLALLSPSNIHLGRNGPIDVHADLLLSVPRTSHTSLTSESESASEPLSHLVDEDSDTSGDLDWENVLDSQVPALPGNPSTAITSPLPESVASFQQEGSDGSGSELLGTVTEGSPPVGGGGGGLMSSAAASVVSLWRAATSHR